MPSYSSYVSLSWGDDEVMQLAHVLDTVAAPAAVRGATKGRSRRAAQLNELYLNGNVFGDSAAVALLSAAAKMQRLTWLNLSENANLGDATLTHFVSLLEQSKAHFTNLKEVRLYGHGAGKAATLSLQRACATRKVQGKLTEPNRDEGDEASGEKQLRRAVAQEQAEEAKAQRAAAWALGERGPAQRRSIESPRMD